MMIALKQALRRSITSNFPRISRILFRQTHAWHIRKLERQLGLPRLNRRVARLTGGRVAAGPFAGMVYVDRATGSQYSPKLIGAYECELHPWIERAMAAGYELFVDVGCAEGFYAVGFARRSASTAVIAFDIDAKARRLTKELAAKNGVTAGVDVREACSLGTFATLPQGRLLVLCDCEGYEADLLVPDAAPRLRSADVLVELHERQSPGVTRLLTERFGQSHRIESVRMTARDPADFPAIAGLSEQDQQLAVSEVRGYPQEWLMMTAKTESGTAE